LLDIKRTDIFVRDTNPIRTSQLIAIGSRLTSKSDTKWTHYKSLLVTENNGRQRVVLEVITRSTILSGRGTIGRSDGFAGDHTFFGGGLCYSNKFEVRVDKINRPSPEQFSLSLCVSFLA
jgi:hypothetical protein